MSEVNIRKNSTASFESVPSSIDLYKGKSSNNLYKGNSSGVLYRGKRRSSPRRRVSPKYKKSSAKRSAPKTPKISSATLNEGDRRKGRDGNFYRVEKRRDGQHYWKKCGKNTGGANCSPMIPLSVYQK